MSLHSGTAAETERKKMLEAEGHIVLNLGQNQYGDLEDVCCNIIIEVKSSKNGRRDISKREKEQMEKLLQLKPFRIIRYDIRFHGNSHHAPVWQEEFPTKIVSSFKLKPITDIQENDTVKIVSKSKVNKNMKVKK